MDDSFQERYVMQLHTLEQLITIFYTHSAASENSMERHPNTTLELMLCSLRANGVAAHLQGQAKDAIPVSVSHTSCEIGIALVCNESLYLSVRKLFLLISG